MQVIEFHFSEKQKHVLQIKDLDNSDRVIGNSCQFTENVSVKESVDS